MDVIMQYLGQFAAGITTLSLGSVAIIGFSVAKYFKKGAFVKTLFNTGQDKAIKVFGEDNVTQALEYAKDIKLKDVKAEAVMLKEKLFKMENKLDTLLKIFASTGALTEDLQNEVESLL